ncbi:MAG: DCC1-like thiol-disulfide oxidoreductase family protein [Bacteroidetes bacterium]|nr:DCC1-like thiol-disulfide oxidoreductase family protein [Bacteroidota bacterium]
MKTTSHIVYYDGYCGLCHASVRFIIKHDKYKVFRYASLQSDFAQQRLPQHHLKTTDTIILFANGNLLTKSIAVFTIVQLLGFPYNMLLVFKAFPISTGNRVYYFISKHRYRVWGKLNTCLLPSQKHKDLFLDT